MAEAVRSESQKRSPVPLYGVDGSIFTYLIEPDRELEEGVARVLGLAASGCCRLVTSVLVLVDLLAVPKQSSVDPGGGRFSELFRCSPNLSMQPVDLDTVRVASDLRAAYELDVPRAVQVATAIRAGACAFLTRDRTLDVIEEVRVISLAEVLTNQADPTPTNEPAT